MCWGGKGASVVGLTACSMYCGQDGLGVGGWPDPRTVASVAMRSSPVESRATSTSSPVALGTGVSKVCTTGGGALAVGRAWRNNGGDGRLMTNGLGGLGGGGVESELSQVLNVVTEDPVLPPVTKANAPVEENVTALAGAVKAMVCRDCRVE